MQSIWDALVILDIIVSSSRERGHIRFLITSLTFSLSFFFLSSCATICLNGNTLNHSNSGSQNIFQGNDALWGNLSFTFSEIFFNKSIIWSLLDYYTKSGQNWRDSCVTVDRLLIEPPEKMLLLHLTLHSLMHPLLIIWNITFVPQFLLLLALILTSSKLSVLALTSAEKRTVHQLTFIMWMCFTVERSEQSIWSLPVHRRSARNQNTLRF